MQKKTVSMQIANGETPDVSNLLELTLSSLKITREKSIQYTFLVEEALLVWREQLPDDSILTFKREDMRNNVRFIFSIPGEKINPLNVKVDLGGEFTMAHAVDRLCSGIGNELKYSYKKGNNRLILSLPKKNQEATILKRNILYLMIPFTFQALMTSVASNVDTFMLGFQNSLMMSGVSFASAFITIVFEVLEGIIAIASATISQYWGKRDREHVNQVAGLTMITSLAVGIIFFVSALFFSPQIMQLYTDKTEIAAYGARYLQILAPSLLLTSIYQALFCYLQTLGKVKKALVFSVIGCATNVLVNFVLIFGIGKIPAMGVTGAAIATIAGAFVQFALAAIELMRSHLVTIKVFTEFTVDVKAFFSNIFIIVSQNLVWNIAANIIAAAFGHMNADIIAANSIIQILSGLMLSARAGFGRSVGLIIGNTLGKNQLNTTKRNADISLRFGFGMAAMIIPLFLAMGFSIPLLPMNFSEASVAYLPPLLLTYAVNVFFCFMNGVLVFGMLLVGRDTKPVLLIDTAVMWGIMVPLSLARIYISALPLILTMCVLKLDELFSFPLKFGRYKKYKWLRNITENDK